MQVPKGWTVASDPKSGQVAISGGQQASALVTILPLFTQQSLDSRAAALLLAHELQQIDPDTRWTQPLAPAAGIVRATGNNSNRRSVGLLTYVATASGTSAYLYITGARSQDYAGLAGTFAQILQSFQVQGTPQTKGGPSAAQLQYVTWRDPTEGAYSVQIPKGWRTQGGTFRPVPELVTVRLEVASPDNAIYLYVGDFFPIYSNPNAALSSIGVRQGSIYTLADGYRSPVEPYDPGVRYVLDYLLPSRHLSQLQIVDQRDRPDLAAAIPTVGGQGRHDAGQVDYTFVRNGQQYRGAALCITEDLVGGDGAFNTGLWHVWRLYLFEAQASRYDEGSQAYAQLAQTYAFDPQWEAREQHTQAQQIQAITSAGQQISQLITQGYAGRQAVMSEINERREKSILDQIDVTDPTTQTTYRVDSSASYYWIDKSGDVVGTQTNSKPDVDFRPLVINPQQ